MKTFYNEWDTKTAAWLRELARQGHVTEGIVDERSIKDIQPDDVREYKRCHFFAGIGGWEYALKLAGWPDDRPVWTGSCPCQPFSSAGKRQGQADERHLWPDWFRLIRECRPDTIIGEQVASAIGHGWLDGVFADLEGIGYTCGAVVLGAHSVGAPHIRQRLWWVAYTSKQPGERRARGLSKAQARVSSEDRTQHGDRVERSANGGEGGGLGITRRDGSQGECEAGATCGTTQRACAVGGVEYNQVNRLQEHDQVRGIAGTGCGVGGVEFANECGCDEAHCAIPPRQFGEASPWVGATTIPCGDGKTRRLKPGISPLVDGVPRGVVPSGDYDVENTAEARVARLRGYGNAIVPQVAAAFIRAFMDCEKA